MRNSAHASKKNQKTPPAPPEDLSSTSQGSKRNWSLVSDKNQTPPPEAESSISPSAERPSSLVLSQTNTNPTRPEAESSTSPSAERPSSPVLNQTTPNPTQHVSFASPQAERREPLGPQTKQHTPTKDVSSRSHQAAQQGAARSRGIRAKLAEKKKLIDDTMAQRKATAATVAVAKRPAPASEDEQNKRFQGDQPKELDKLPDAAAEPFPFKDVPHDWIRFHPCFAVVSFPGSKVLTFGRVFGQSKGTEARVRVTPGKWGDPSVMLQMSVNKGSLEENLANDEKDVSKFSMVWQPYIKTGDSYRIQEFTFGIVSRSEALQHSDVMEQAKEAKKDVSRMSYVKMATNGFFVPVGKEYEAEHWRRLTRVDDEAATEMAVCANLMSKAKDDNNLTVEFWFNNKLGQDVWAATVAAPFKRIVDERRPWYHQYYQNNEPVFDIYKAPTQKDVGDGMYVKKAKGKTEKGKVLLPTDLFVFPQHRSFPDDAASLLVYAQGVIRAAHFRLGLSTEVESEACHFFLRPMESAKIIERVMPGHIQRKKSEAAILNDTFRACVRIPNVPQIRDESMLPIGLKFKVDFSSERVYRGHVIHLEQQSKDDRLYSGEIVPPNPIDELVKTGTTFAARLTKAPKAFRPHAKDLHETLEYLPNFELCQGRIEVLLNFKNEKQEIHSLQACWASGSPLLKTVRSCITASALPKTGRFRDLTVCDGSSVKWDFDAYVESLCKTPVNPLNPSQREALMSLQRAEDGISVIQGPPGTGKTTICVEAVAALLGAGHKVHVAGPIHVSIDRACDQIFKKVEDTGKKVLRLEVDQINERDLLRGLDGQSASSITDDARIADAINIFLDLEHGAELDARLADVDTLEEEHLALTRRTPRNKRYDSRAGEVYQLQETLYEDYVDALKEWKPTATPTPMEKVSEFEYANMKGSRSKHYWQLVLRIRKLHGSAPDGTLARQWKDERLRQLSRVIAAADCVLATTYSSGKEIAVAGFKATILVCEEAGQMTIPAMCVALATYGNALQGLIVLGDHLQLKPVQIEGKYNEFGPDMRISFLELLVEKGRETSMLTTSYRFHSLLCRFPSWLWYGQLLVSDPSTEKDNDILKAAREIRTALGLKVQSEYMLLNVYQGVARPNINGGTSMQNYANANAVTGVVASYLEKGVAPKDIAILTMYKGQQAITKRKLIEQIGDHNLPGKLRAISTIDAFQGQQSPIVILDLVIANRAGGGPAAKKFDPQRPMGAWQKVSKYAQEANRINVGLTRCQYALTIVCHVPTIKATTHDSRAAPDMRLSTLAALVRDAEEYGLIEACPANDDHPRAAEEVEAIS